MSARLRCKDRSASKHNKKMSLKLRERKYAIEQIEWKTMRSDRKNQSEVVSEANSCSVIMAEIQNGGLSAINGERTLYLYGERTL